MAEGESLQIELEPEGASLACRDDLIPVWRNFGRPDIFRYMVVDCGGGTVDITIHDLNMNTKTITEVHQANGGGWGGTCVDDEIEKLVCSIVGESLFGTLEPAELLHWKRHEIEKTKRRVRDHEGMVSLSLPFELASAIMQNGGQLQGEVMQGVTFRTRHQSLQFRAGILESCFKKSLTAITNHIRGKMQEIGGIQCLLLVGGFAESPLLFNHLKGEFYRPNCHVIRPENASLAVLRGAVMYGQNPDTIETRCSKYTYGVETKAKFNPSIHPEDHKVVIDGEEYCRNVFTRIVKVGDPVKIGHRFEHRFSPIHADQTEINLDIYRSKQIDPRFTDSETKLDCIPVPMPDTRKGKDRTAFFELDFSRTEIHCTAFDADHPERRFDVKVGFNYRSQGFMQL